MNEPTEKRITYSVISWSARYKAQILIDGSEHEHELFDSYREATKWARKRHRELMQPEK